MISRVICFLFVFPIIAFPALQEDDSFVDKQPRRFKLKYAATINDVPEGSVVNVWFPIAQSNDLQSVDIIAANIPGKFQINKGRKYGNRIGYFEKLNAGKFEIEYQVERQESRIGNSNSKLTEQEKQLFLKANAKVPVEGRPVELIEGVDLSKAKFDVGRQLYEIVETYMTYDKSKPGYGNGDVLWACDSKTGNCTDFHSVFISLARNQKIPARFEIGFPIPTDAKSGSLGGYHCWAWFFTEESGWVAVDISEADKHPEMKEYYFGRLTPDRVAFSTGRDITLSPESKSGPLNYFVYPHVEVNGQVWPKTKIKLDFSYSNN